MNSLQEIKSNHINKYNNILCNIGLGYYKPDTSKKEIVLKKTNNIFFQVANKVNGKNKRVKMHGCKKTPLESYFFEYIKS